MDNEFVADLLREFRDHLRIAKGIDYVEAPAEFEEELTRAHVACCRALELVENGSGEKVDAATMEERARDLEEWIEAIEAATPHIEQAQLLCHVGTNSVDDPDLFDDALGHIETAYEQVSGASLRTEPLEDLLSESSDGLVDLFGLDQGESSDSTIPLDEEVVDHLAESGYQTVGDIRETSREPVVGDSVGDVFARWLGSWLDDTFDDELPVENLGDPMVKDTGESRTIRVTVLDGSNQTVSAADVALTGQTPSGRTFGSDTVTGDRGAGELEIPAAVSEVSLSVDIPDNGSYSVQRTLDPGTTTKVWTVQVEESTDADRTLRITVFNTDQRPVSDAEVTVSGGDFEAAAITGTNGDCSLEIPADTRELTVDIASKEGSCSEERTLDPGTGTKIWTVQLDAEDEEGHGFDEPRSLRMTILDSSGSPLADGEVTVTGQSFTTDGQTGFKGSCAVEIPADTSDVTVEVDSPTTEVYTEQRTLDPGTSTKIWTIQMGEQGDLTEPVGNVLEAVGLSEDGSSADGKMQTPGTSSSDDDITPDRPETSDGDGTLLEAYCREVGIAGDAKEQIDTAIGSGSDRIEDLVETHEAGELRTSPGQTEKDTLNEKVIEALEWVRDTIVAIAKESISTTDTDPAGVPEPSIEAVIEAVEQEGLSLEDIVVEQPKSIDEPTSDPVVVEGVPANPLAEYYEVFKNFATLLKRIIESERTAYSPDGNRPINEWHNELEKLVYESGPPGATRSYGQQQGDRNTVRMANYRQAFGDGEAVTDYRSIRTGRLGDGNHEALINQSVIDPDEQFVLPVAPTSGTQLPLVVSSENELERALELLEEFPANPEPAPRDDDRSEIDQTSKDEEPSGGSSTGKSASEDETQSGADREGTDTQNDPGDDERTSSITDKIMDDLDDL